MSQEPKFCNATKLKKKSQLKFLEWIQGFLRHSIIKKDNPWDIVTINKLSQKIQQKAQNKLQHKKLTDTDWIFYIVSLYDGHHTGTLNKMTCFDTDLNTWEVIRCIVDKLRVCFPVVSFWSGNPAVVDSFKYKTEQNM